MISFGNHRVTIIRNDISKTIIFFISVTVIKKIFINIKALHAWINIECEFFHVIMYM